MDREDLIYSSLFTDMMSEGFIYIDSQGKIRLYNEMAKKIFGLKTNLKINHKSGSLEAGDIVIIVNNAFGQDDGKMNSDSLKLLGLKGDEIKEASPFILVSRYKGENLSLKLGSSTSETLSIKKEVDGLDIGAKLDLIKREMLICLGDKAFPLNYVRAIGHMVILSAKTGDLKFYQTYGYTARKESINDILLGASYKEKLIGRDYLEVLGKNIFDIHSSESIIEDFFNLAKGEGLGIKNKFEEINGFPTLCSLYPVDIRGKRTGAVLKVENISQIEKVIRERDNILNKLEKASRKIEENREIDLKFKKFIGREKSIIQVKELAYRASKNNSNVLIVGESGVGKSLLAKLIHRNSSLADEKFLQLNSRVLGPGDIEKRLEGLEAGTIYLDDVSKLSPLVQEELVGLITRVINPRFRLIASTSENLDRKLMEDKFNERLYYFINIFPIYIPPLRDRKLDIRNLVDYLLPEICKRLNIEEKRISLEALDIIENYTWPDNVRELINVLERAGSLAMGKNILTKHIVLLKDIEKKEEGKTLKKYLEEYEKNIIQTSLIKNKGDRKASIRELGISQSTFYEKLSKYDIKLK